MQEKKIDFVTPVTFSKPAGFEASSPVPGGSAQGVAGTRSPQDFNQAVELKLEEGFEFSSALAMAKKDFPGLYKQYLNKLMNPHREF